MSEGEEESNVIPLRKKKDPALTKDDTRAIAEYFKHMEEQNRILREKLEKERKDRNKGVRRSYGLGYPP